MPHGAGDARPPAPLAPLATIPSQMTMRKRKDNFGILAMELYFPNYFVCQAALGTDRQYPRLSNPLGP